MTLDTLAFNKPTRQSILAVFLIIQKSIRQIIRQLWPILLVFVIGNTGGRSKFLLIFILLFTSLSMLWAIVSYYKYYFYINNDELIINKGVLQKTNLNIPFDRIQSINFQQSLLHRILNVVKVEIDTAGSSKSELALDALTLDNANLLRDIILSQKTEGFVSTSDEKDYENEKLVFSINIPDLLRISISQNHLRSGWLIIVFGMWIVSQLDDIGVDIENLLQGWFSSFSILDNFIYAALFVIVIIISLLISIARVIIKFYNLSLWRSGHKYRLVHGLFTKQEVTILDKKIQILEWKDNPLKKVLGLFDVYIKQASGNAVRLNKSIQVPGCNYEQVQNFHNNWLDTDIVDYREAHRVSVNYWYRRLFFRWLFSGLFIYLLYFFQSKFFFPGILLIPYFFISSWLAYKKRRYLITDHLLYISRGVFGDHFSVMPLYKIQSVILKQNRFEHRRNLATLNVSTASGRLSIPYIKLSFAQSISNYVLYKTEASTKSWM